jgi:hypothetical protein
LFVIAAGDDVVDFSGEDVLALTQRSCAVDEFVEAFKLRGLVVAVLAERKEAYDRREEAEEERQRDDVDAGALRVAAFGEHGAARSPICGFRGVGRPLWSLR